MYSVSLIDSFQTFLNGFKLKDTMIRYSKFMSQLYNFCPYLSFVSMHRAGGFINCYSDRTVLHNRKLTKHFWN